MHSQLNYLSLPLNFVLNTSDEYRQQGFVSIGIEPAFMTGFEEIYNTIDFGADVYKNITISGETLTLDTNVGGTQINKVLKIDYLYRRFDIGLNFAFGFRHTFSDVFGISLAARGSFGLLEPENRNASYIENDIKYLRWKTPKFAGLPEWLPHRPRTYQIHAGLELKAFYSINR